jgi:hypothetical protein
VSNMTQAQFKQQVMDIDGVHCVVIDHLLKTAHIYTTKTRAVQSFTRYAFPEGIKRMVIEKTGKPARRAS